MSKIAVVIPFFQREPSILARALRSALGQDGIDDMEILVVDDGSPVRACDELSKFSVEERARIRIIEQVNGGPAAARNTALAHVGAQTEYVAFLDSDDEWTPEHLSNAMAVLEQGFDFYFSDFYQLDQKVSAFKRAGRIHIQEHPLVRNTEPFHVFNGSMFDQILSGNIIGTPTVVYRFATFPTLRFREEFVYAGEDYLFWIDLSKLTNRIAFSSQCECRCGRGVNVFAGSGWGTDKSLQRTHYEMKFKKALIRLYDLSEGQSANTRLAITRLRRHFVADVLHRVMHRRSMDNVLLKHLKLDVKSFLYFIPLSIDVLIERARSTKGAPHA